MDKLINRLEGLRFKTRDEFEKEFGSTWRYSTTHWFIEAMDYLLGKKIDAKRCTEFGFEGDTEVVLLKGKDDDDSVWYISEDMLTSVKAETITGKEIHLKVTIEKKKKEDKEEMKMNKEQERQATNLIRYRKAIGGISNVTFNLAKNRDIERKIRGIQNNEKLSDEEKATRIEHVKNDNIVTVKLDDGRIGIAKCAPGDQYDEFTGFAIAFARAIFGSSNGLDKALKHFNGEEAKEKAAKEKIRKAEAVKKLAEYKAKASKGNKKKKILAE